MNLQEEILYQQGQLKIAQESHLEAAKEGDKEGALITEINSNWTLGVIAGLEAVLNDDNKVIRR